MEHYQDDTRFLLLDSRSVPLAHGKLESAVDAPALQMLVLNGKADEVARHEIIQIAGMRSDKLAIQCQVLRQRGERIILNKISQLGSDFQRNLRVPVQFESFIYPLSGAWKGRRSIQSVDLSCGGIAFYSRYGLKNGERFEVVIPITAQPVVLRGEILRQQTLAGERCFYAAKFVDMCNDEEFIVREAVFRVQIQGAAAGPRGR